MMDPEMVRLAQEQMSRMTPADFAKIQQQMMSNPDLIRMATESMRNMRPQDLRNAAEQLRNTRPEDMAEIGEKMANSTPEELSNIRTQLDAKIAYELNGAQMLKNQGNELHGQGKYRAASQKYLLAKNNLKEIPSSKVLALQLACSLNLMSCYLKTKQFDECVKEGSEVLTYDSKNVKALYRRGQAYKELGQFRDAVCDFSKAREASPDDETIAVVLRDTQERLAEQGDVEAAPSGLVIEEINDDEEAVPPCNSTSSSSETLSQEITDSNRTERVTTDTGLSFNSEQFQALKSDPNALRSFQNFVANANPETLAALNPDNSGAVSADMTKTALNMIGKMSPEELQRMFEMASSFQSDNPGFTGSPFTSRDNFRPELNTPNMSPEMIKTATDMMGKMSPEEFQKMFEMASNVRGNTAIPTAGSASGSSSVSRESFVTETDVQGETSSQGSVSNTTSTPSLSSFPNSTADMQEQMRNQMKDPAMRQMFSSMIKNMSPEMMANMGEQFGFKLSREDAEKAQQAMSSFSPEDLDKMMRWADRIQRGVEGARKTKNWLLGKPGMILAICMLILAMILHRLGFIGG